MAVDTRKWRPALPEDAWPRDFPLDPTVWRQDVFAVADRWRAGGASARQLLAATLMWTYGAESYGRRRTARALAGDPTGVRLEGALQPLRSETPGMVELRGAYLAFRTHARLPWFDADLSTRLLYFAGYRRGAPGVQPLILDEIIARRIPEDSGVTNQANRGSSLEWVRYLCWAAAQAGVDLEPDRVEMDLAAGGARYGQASREPVPARARHARR